MSLRKDVQDLQARVRRLEDAYASGKSSATAKSSRASKGAAKKTGNAKPKK